MANVNKVLLIGRLTRDPEVRVFANGGKVALIGFATNNPRKNQTTGEWEDNPTFIDVKLFNRGETGTLADRAEQNLHKGDMVYLEGRLIQESWDDKQTGQKRSKHVVYADNYQFLARPDGTRGGEGTYSQRSSPPRTVNPPTPEAGYDEPESHMGVANTPPDEDNIPF